jgi:alpha-ketoglutarate-dependent taurine dioxygenase
MNISFINEQKLPLVVEPSNEVQNKNLDALIAESLENRNFLHEKLLRHGALLFRGYDIQSAADFERFVRAFSGKELLNYAGGVSPRVELGGGVYTSTEYPSQFMLALHNELSYSDKYPQNVYFCCLVAPENDGETPIGDSRKILKSIKPEIVREFKSKQIRYDRNLFGDSGSGFSWQDAFETTDKSIVESYCRQSNIDFKWKADGKLFLSQIRPATAIHTQTGEEVWFNQADGFHPSNLDAETYNCLIALMPEEEFRLNAHFGDGSPLDVSTLDEIRETLRKEMVIFPWRKGDVLILDNLLTAHGRMPFSGARKIVLAMT